ncbi:MAG: T9SS type A sorting domain-containing protein [Crocinitomicaceae bacterium]|nr:T9SS type A sorting domain-containing protein [Crocinitomicaceae bacterium]
MTFSAEENQANLIQLFNVMGELIYEIELNPSTSATSINISDLAAGIYFVQLNDQTAKFVKQ